MAPRRSSGCGACIPELTIRRHRGQLLRLDSRAKPSTLRGSHRRFGGGSVFHTSFRGLLLSLFATQQKWRHHLQQVVQSLIPHNYYVHQVQYIRWCTQQTVCSTHTHTRTVTERFVYIQLYSNLYLFEYCCFHLNSGTTSRYRSPKQEALAPFINSQRVEKCL